MGSYGVAFVLLPLLFCPTLSHTTNFLAGKSALVTGSSGGIGKAIALELASHGANVLVHCNTRFDGAKATQSAILASGGQCAGIVKCDFRSPLAIRGMFSDLESLLPDGLDIVVNNAGVVSKVPLEDEDDELSNWHETLQINLHAPLQISKLAVEQMMKKGSGVIINVSSIHGQRSNEYMAAYAASKAALDSLTRTMAIEYASLGIRVNAIAPGVVPVERTADFFSKPENVENWTKHIPLRRVGTVENIAQAVVPLITNDWVTGTVWDVDGGLMARTNMPSRERPTKPLR